MRGLYAIADVSTLSLRGIDVLDFARAVLAAHPAALQLRAKDLPAPEMLALLQALVPICRGAGVPLVANDRVEVAALAGCDYVHLGQEDTELTASRALAPQLRVGLSTHTPEQLSRALALRPAYVAYGPVYATASKERPDPVVGIDGLRAASVAARAARVPLVAIGGLSLERAAEVAPCAEAGAVIAALVPPGGAVDFAEVTARARRLHAALLGDGSAAEAAP